jgi:putative oxidoreductase
MSMSETKSRYTPVTLSLLRIVAALIMLEHGTQKMFGYPPIVNVVPHSMLSEIAGWIEVVGGVPLILGLFSRPIAFIFAGEMAVGYFLRHSPRGIFPVNNGGDLAVLLCFVFLFLAASGPGPLSLDALWQRRTRPSA